MPKHLASLSELCKPGYVDVCTPFVAIPVGGMRARTMAKILRGSPKAIQIGERIANKRRDKGITQVQLAGLIGVTAGLIGQYEVGFTVPSPGRLESIAVTLDTTVTWLLTGDDPEELVKAQTVNEREALAKLRQLSHDKQESALAMLDGLIARITKP